MSGEDDDNENKDLTRIEDLSEFLHEENDELDSQLDTYDDGNDEDAGPLPSLDDLDDDTATQEFSEDSSEDSVDFSDDSDSDTDEDNSFESDDNFESNDDDFSSDEVSDDFEQSEDETIEMSPEDDAESEAEDFSDEQADDLSFEEADNNSEDENEISDEFGGDDFAGNDEFGGDDFSDSTGPSDEDQDEISFDSSDDFNEETEENDEIDENEITGPDDSAEEDDFEDITESDSPEEAIESAQMAADELEEQVSQLEDDNDEEDDHQASPVSDSLPSGIEVVNPTSEEFQQGDIQTQHQSETFQDVREYGNAISYGNVEEGGNPPYSLILKDIKYSEDAEDIKVILSEHGLLTGDNESIIEQGLSNGILLISQISEYSAIYLAHKLRRFDLQIMFGLSDELHISKSYQNESRGLVNKKNIHQNVHSSLSLEKSPVEIENIILSTTPSLEQYHIEEYLGVITEHTVIDELEMERMQMYAQIEQQDQEEDEISSIEDEIAQTKKNLDISEELSKYGLKDIYNDLAENLKTQAIKLNANAIIGINYQLTPLIQNSNDGAQVNYKVTCTGNAVWVSGH